MRVITSAPTCHKLNPTNHRAVILYDYKRLRHHAFWTGCEKSENVDENELQDMQCYTCNVDEQQTRSQHNWKERNVAPQLINLWLTTIFIVFDGVVANRQTHAKHCIAAIGLDAYVGRIHRIQERQQYSCWYEYKVDIGCSHIQPTRPIYITLYKLLQFER